MKENETNKKYSPCNGCSGGLRCFNENSPCYLQYCGIQPNTGSTGQKSQS